MLNPEPSLTEHIGGDLIQGETSGEEMIKDGKAVPKVNMTTFPMCNLTSDQIDNLPDDDPDEAIDLLEAHELDDDLESVSDVRLKPLTKQFPTMASSDAYVMVAAIDFGTTFSGYAFSFKTEPNNIRMNKSWGTNVGFQAYKTPTCVLVDSNNEFVAFGYEAEDRYAESQKEEEEEEDSDNDSDGDTAKDSRIQKGEDYHLYRQFKMILHKSGKLTRHTTITSVDGATATAMSIFVMALKYIKDHLSEAVSRIVDGGVDVKLFRWVITVPAIWREEAKQFMREAAFKAGYIKTKDSSQLLIALEPEAASLFCRGLVLDNFIGPSNVSTSSFRPGTRYLVIDAGGGIIDLTAHEVLKSGKIKEIHRANGGHWGGTKVDQNFISLLEDILDADFIQKFKHEFPQQWLRFMVSFEKLKRATKPDGKSKINVDFPYNMMTTFEKFHDGKSIAQVFKESSRQGVTFSNGVIVVKHEAVLTLFNPVTDAIIQHISGLVSASGPMSTCQYFLLVGGFAESAFLQKAIEDEFKAKVKIMVPEEAQMCVIKGAVLFGHSPEEIEIRIARKSYGTDVKRKFNAKKHQADHKINIEGRGEMCENLFDFFVKKNSELTVGERIGKSYKAATEKLTTMHFNIYATEKDDVTYVDEDGVEKVGSFEVKMPDTTKGKERSVRAEITFSGTEIQVKATDEETGHTADTTIDFLVE